MDERKEVDRLANLQSVTYTAATVKIICSRHSGSILSQPEPLVPLSSSSAQKAREAFAAALAAKASQSPDESSTESPTLDDTIIYDILLSYGLFRKSIDRDVVSAVIKKYYKGPAALDEQTFLDFLGAFQAPAYNYGQRLRRNAGRGVIEDVRELIIRGCDVNTADGEGLTSLHYASEFNRAGVIRELFALAGEDLLVNAKVTKQNTLYFISPCFNPYSSLSLYTYIFVTIPHTLFVPLTVYILVILIFLYLYQLYFKLLNLPPGHSMSKIRNMYLHWSYYQPILFSAHL